MGYIDKYNYWLERIPDDDPLERELRGIRFDENLADYHFYDADICCQALAAGYDVATIDIAATHTSIGKAPNEIEQYRKVFFEKWSNKIDRWPITRYTKFK